ncbi:hypothetical protein [Marinicella sp. W31]|uniref:hypothetical protein n=1 Tax=Marinicella sp. W31 TaxID=3023713 RepID=UPI003756A110
MKGFVLIGGLLLSVLCFGENFRFSLHEDFSATPERPTLELLHNNSVPTIDVGYTDVFDTQRYQSLLEHKAPAHTQGGQLTFSATTQLPPIRPYISQSIPDVWRVMVPQKWPYLETPVEVKWLMPAIEDQHVLRVEVEPWVQRRMTRADGVEIIEGGVNLHIAVESLHVVDRHKGQLMIDLREF